MEKEELRPPDLDYVRDMVRTRSAIVLEPEKAYLVESRLSPLGKKRRIGLLNRIGGQVAEHSLWGFA